ncbi:MAG TPA: SbcC/MukB-like Walker B domain-containing protein, partial [Plasticicumulans sp.]|nr:SbcC/MukB-like Walker B domain-containing protein [Plasticicumulans sp.]
AAVLRRAAWHRRAVQTATEAAAVLAGLHADRAGLFDGQPTAHVEAALAQAIGQAVAGRDAAQAAVSRAADVRNRAAGQEQAARSARERAGADAAEAARALNDALAEAGLDATEARHRLGFGERWLSDEGAALDALTAALREAGVRHDERRAQAEAHAAARPPLPAADEGDAPSCPPSSDAPEAQLAGAETALRDARTALADLAARLHADDQRRSEGAERRTALAARRLQAAPWLALKELIGSADGSKFRGFAQSLTLEALVAHANAHLQELARRYRLRRVPGAGLELMVVDRDMADEVRGVHSLSGGETFLVSLALALGLASLSSNRVQVETLLIDEGFGTLDPDTLDIAVAALDALQGQGRQVGVISHVPALVERIGVQVRVRALGGGRSRIETVTGG